MNYKELILQKIWNLPSSFTQLFTCRYIKSRCVCFLVYSINTLGYNTGLKSVQPIQHSRLTREMRKWSEKLAERVNEISLGLLEYKDKYSGQRTAAYENTSRTELNGHIFLLHMGHQSQIKKKKNQGSWNRANGIGKGRHEAWKEQNNRAQSSGEHQP